MQWSDWSFALGCEFGLERWSYSDCANTRTPALDTVMHNAYAIRTMQTGIRKWRCVAWSEPALVRLVVFCFEITCECGKFAFCFAFWRRGGSRAQVHVRDAAREASVDLNARYAAYGQYNNYSENN